MFYGLSDEVLEKWDGVLRKYPPSTSIPSNPIILISGLTETIRPLIVLTRSLIETTRPLIVWVSNRIEMTREPIVLISNPIEMARESIFLISDPTETVKWLHDYKSSLSKDAGCAVLKLK